MKTLILITIILNTTLQATLTKPQNPQTERRLTETDLLSMELIEKEKNFSVEKIRDEIIDLHRNVQNCISEEFEKTIDEILPYNDILRMCVGDNYSIVLNFYKEINYEIKEITKEKIKNKMDDNFCTNILFECVAFFKKVGLFIDLDYDLMSSMEDNKEELERKIEPENLRYLINLTENEIGDYSLLRDDLLQERKFLTEFFKEKFEEYERKHPGHAANAAQNDTI